MQVAKLVGDTIQRRPQMRTLVGSLLLGLLALPVFIPTGCYRNTASSA
jgi:hypothetical protein